MNQYHYTPLNASNNEIRLLHVEPGAADSTLVCRLVHFPLDDCPPYFALSYAWGDSAIRRQILLEGNNTSITTNLYSALYHLRLKAEGESVIGGETVVVWADALCINQNDIPERNQQVRLMRNVYRSALAVVAFLGEPSDDSDMALDIIENKDGGGFELLRRTSYDPGPPASREWQSIKALFDRPWWSRAWIAQEIAVNRRPAFLLCGQKAVSWSRFYPMHRWLLHSSIGYQNAVDLQDRPTLGLGAYSTLGLRFNYIPSLEYLRFQASEDASEQFTDAMMLIFGEFEASDPRDLIFAFVGMAKQYDQAQLLPDYAQDVQSVYTDAIKFFIAAGGKLDILALNCITTRQQGWPTWVPNFQTPRAMRAALIQHGTGFAASGSNPINVQYLDQPSTIVLKGIPVDRVATVIHLSTVEESLLRVYSVNPIDNSQTSEPSSHMYLKQTMDFLLRYWEATNDHIAVSLSLTVAGRRVNTSGADWRTLTCDREFIPNGTNDNPSGSRLKIPASRAVGTAYALLRSKRLLEAELSTDQIRAVYALGKPFLLNFWSMNGAGPGKAYFITERGFLGTGPAHTQVGDEVAVLFGGQAPYVLRPCDTDHYEFIGESFVYGIMDGQLVQDPEYASKERDFIIR